MRKFWKSEEGATAVEYGLIVSLISVAIIAGATLVGGSLDAMFTNVSNQL